MTWPPALDISLRPRIGPTGPRDAADRMGTVARLACGGALSLVMLLAPAIGRAENGPRQPCGREPSPAYADVGSPPAVRVWAMDELGAGWVPPACSGWSTGTPRVLVTVAGRFRHTGGVDGLLTRLGAVSTLTTIRYWSVTDQRWESLVTRASALDGRDGARRRPDFRLAEMTVGADLYLAQRDNRSTSEVVYRMRVREAAADRLVVETENVGTMRYLVVPLAGPGDLQALHVFRRQGSVEWAYDGLTRIGPGASPLLGGHAASYANRAVALFRHVAGLATDGDPPAAP